MTTLAHAPAPDGDLSALVRDLLGDGRPSAPARWAGRARAGWVEPIARDVVATGPASAAADDAGVAARADRRDVAATLGGDHEAFAQIVQRHQQTVTRQMYRFTRDTGRLEELVQDVFVEAFRSLPTWRAEAPFLHWLRRIAVRVGYRWWREDGRRETALPDGFADALAGSDGDSSAREVAEWVHALLARLPPRDRLVLTLLSIEEHPVAEVARLTGWSRAMVKVQAMRARRKLRRLVEAEQRRWR